MRCKKCNVDLGENYTKCPLCGGDATDEKAKIQGITTAEYSSAKPVKSDDAPKAKKNFSIEKLKAIFNL